MPARCVLGSRLSSCATSSLDEPVFVRVRQASRTDFVGTVSLSVVVVGANRREAAAGTIDLRTPKVGAV